MDYTPPWMTIEEPAPIDVEVVERPVDKPIGRASREKIADLVNERPLTDTEITLAEEFVVEYVRDFKPREAVIRMGYRATVARSKSKEFLEIPYVQRRIKECLQDCDIYNMVQASDVVSGLMEIANDVTNDAAVRLRANVELGKILGLYVERVHSIGEMTPTINLHAKLPSPQVTDE